VPRLRREYRIELSRGGTLITDRGHSLDVPPTWTPEHLILAALARCTLLALEHHARRESLSAGIAATAHGEVDRREDGSWGFTRLDCALDVSFDPLPSTDDLQRLLDGAEHGCFVGASLTPKPTYRWRINGVDVR
jgi:organic hydroperoxide reductase OsmC/OhrA